MSNRISAKKVVAEYAAELKKRVDDPDQKAKLIALETVARRMGWHKLFNELRFAKPSDKPTPGHFLHEIDIEPRSIAKAELIGGGS